MIRIIKREKKIKENALPQLTASRRISMRRSCVLSATASNSFMGTFASAAQALSQTEMTTARRTSSLSSRNLQQKGQKNKVKKKNVY
jgi:hypothetical protein